MDDKLFKILKKTYCKKKKGKDKDGNIVRIETGDIWDTKTKTTKFSTDILTEREKKYLSSTGYQLNEIIGYSHDDCIKDFKGLLKHSNLNIDNLISAYVCGFSSFPRGRQPIISYLFAKAVPEHSYSPICVDVCKVCSIQEQIWVNKGYEIFRKYWGYAWTENWGKYLVDLQEFVCLKPCTPTIEDIRIFNDLIELIRIAPAKETIGKLEDRVKKSKTIPDFEKYRFRGQLMVLAELGVMPNKHIKPLYDGFTSFEQRCKLNEKSVNSRSDVILPLSGWSGDNAIDEIRLKELFEQYIL